MRRHRPRKPRNPYADRLWMRQVLRALLRRRGFDLDALDNAFAAAMRDDRQ